MVASGNGGQYNDNCNYDGYANSIYTITIGKRLSLSAACAFFKLTGIVESSQLKCIFVTGAVDEKGKKPFYAEDCASMLAVTFSSGGNKLRNIVCLPKTRSKCVIFSITKIG